MVSAGVDSLGLPLCLRLPPQFFPPCPLHLGMSPSVYRKFLFILMQNKFTPEICSVPFNFLILDLEMLEMVDFYILQSHEICWSLHTCTLYGLSSGSPFHEMAWAIYVVEVSFLLFIDLYHTHTPALSTHCTIILHFSRQHFFI